MLRVDQYEYIRTAHRVYGKNVSEIARETGHSRNTVKKVLRGEFTGYSPRQKQPYPVLGPYHEIIYKWLEEDLESPKKQRHTAKRIYILPACERIWLYRKRNDGAPPRGIGQEEPQPENLDSRPHLTRTPGKPQ